MRRSTKIWLIVAASLILIGVVAFGGVMMSLKWNFTALTTVKYETNTYEIDESFSDIKVVCDTSDIGFVPCEEEGVRVVCYERSSSKYSVNVKDGALEIKVENSGKWYEYIGINFSSPKITVYLPEKVYANIEIKTSTGDVSLGSVSADNVSVSVRTGDVKISNASISEKLAITVTTGDANVENTTCKSLVSKGNTGDILLDRVRAEDRIEITRSTGDVTFKESDADSIFVATGTGEVKGSLLTGKTFTVKTSTGDVNVPKNSEGGTCNITTSTGDVKITVK